MSHQILGINQHNTFICLDEQTGVSHETHDQWIEIWYKFSLHVVIIQLLKVWFVGYHTMLPILPIQPEVYIAYMIDELESPFGRLSLKLGKYLFE